MKHRRASRQRHPGRAAGALFAWLALLLSVGLAAAEVPVIAHWPMRIEAGAVPDDGPQHLTGRLFGQPVPSAAEAPFGLALELAAGGNGGVEVPHHPLLDLRPPFTVAAWVRPGPVSGAMEIVCHGGDTDPGGWRLRCGWGMAMFQMGVGQGKPFSLSTPARQLPTEHWMHLAAVHDGHALTLFVNAEPAAQADAPAPQPRATKLVLGNYSGRKNAYPLVGRLGDVWLLGAALDSEGLYRLASGR